VRRTSDGIRRRDLLVGTGRALALAPLASAVLAAACGPSDTQREEPGAAPPAAPPAAQPQPAPAPQAPAPPPAAGGAADGRLVTEVQAMQATVTSLQYVNASAKPDQHCSNCLFYTTRTADRGKCQLFTQGLVAATGWCASWQPKQP
jgi:hypothetical protein